MEKIKKWRRFALALFSLLFVGILSFAIVKIVPAEEVAAATDLSGNTAEYTLDEGLMSAWRYSYSSSGDSYWYNQGGQGSTGKPAYTQLVFTITKAGDFAVKWKSDRNKSSHQSSQFWAMLTVTHHKNADASDVTICEKAELDPATDTKEGSYGYSRFITVDSVAEGDTITFDFEHAQGTSNIIMQPPQNTSDLNVSVADDSTNGGQIKWSDENGGSGNGTDLSLTSQWGKKLTLTAVPEDGYVFSNWTDETGAIVSTKEEYVVTNVFSANGKSYYAHFFPQGETRITPSSQWEKTTETAGDRYTLNWEQMEKGDTATLTFEFFVQEGGAYLDFGYFLSVTDPNSTLSMTLDGSTNSHFKTDNMQRASADEEMPLHKYSQFIPEAGYHQIVLSMWAHPSAFEQDERNALFIENLRLCQFDDLPKTKIQFEFDEYFEITVKYKKNTESVSQVVSSGVPIELPIGLSYDDGVSFTEKVILNKKTSVIDPSQEVTLAFANFSGNFTGNDGAEWSTTNNTAWLSLYGGGRIGERGMYSNGTPVNYTIPEQDVATIRVAYRESAPKPVVSATKNIGTQSEEIEQIQNGDDITFDFGSENAITIRMKGFDALSKENYVVQVDRTAYNGQISYFEGEYGFVLTDVRDKEITISYSIEGYNCSAATMTFTVHETAKGGLNGILKSDNLQVENDSKFPWNFDAENSEEGQYAFKPTNSYKKGDKGYPFEMFGDGSALTFSFTEAEQGSLSFEFKIHGTHFHYNDMLDFISAQAFYRFDQPFTQEEYQTSVNGVQGKKPDNTTLLAEATSTDVVSLGSGVVDLGNGWYRAQISVNATTVKKVYVAYVSGMNSMGIPTSGLLDESYMVVRNARFITGNSNVKIETNSIGGTSTITATANGDTKENQQNAEFNIPAGTYLNLQANPSPDEVFYGWVMNDEFYSAQTNVMLSIEKDMSIIAYMAPKDYYEARLDGVFYQKFLGEGGALASASSGSLVLLKSEMTISQNLEIPENVTIILPFNELGEYYGSGAPSGKYESGTQIAWASEQLIRQNKKFELKIAANAKLTINGSLIVGGVLNHAGQGYQGHTSGAYAELILDGTIEVKDGGVMDVYGRVTGKGSIDVKSGGKLYQPFLILDFPGGTYTLNTFMQNMTPFKRYAMVNIEVPFTIEHGAQLVGHASLWALDMLVSLDQPFISDENGAGDADTMIMLKPGASVTVKYDPNRVVNGATTTNCTELIGHTTLTFSGGADFSYMQFTAMGITIPTTSVYFSIPYNFDLILGGKGTYETRTDFMIMPGATVTVEEGSTLQLHASAWVYDGLAQGALASKFYPTADELSGTGYSKSGNLIVNGKLIIDKKWGLVDGIPSESNLEPATFLGIVQTNGTGEIEIKEGTILQGKIADGLKDRNYFAYTTTARVWDKVTGEFVDLEAGRNYKATSGENFKLEELLYTKTEGGDESLTLSLDSDMVGSWMLEHGEHVFNWEKADGDELPTAESKHTQIERACSVMGCDHKETRELVYAPGDWGHLTYTGEEFGEEQIKAKIKEWFEEYDLFTAAGGSVAFESIQDYNESGYDVTVTLTKGFWATADGYTADATEKTLKIYVDRAALTEEDVTMSEEAVTYTGEAITKEVKVSFNGKDLTAEKDYNVSYSGVHTDVGTVTVTVTGAGNFTGEVVKTFEIVARDIEGAEITLQEGEFVYTGEKIEPTVSSVSVNGRELAATKDFTVEYGENKNAGENGGSVIIRAAEGNYTGTATANFTIEKATLESATIKGESSFVYNGQARTVGLEVKTANGLTIPETEFDVAYSDNTNVGQATAKVTVKAESENYANKEGVSVTFTITAKEVTVTVSKQEKTFNGDTQAYDADWAAEGLENGEEKSVLGVSLQGSGKDAGAYDVTASYESRNYTVTFKAAEGLSVKDGATIEGALVITQKDASAATVKVTSEHTYNSEEQTVTVTVTLEGFGPFVENTDYTISYAEDADRINAGTVNFTVNFKGNYSGSTAQQTFEIKQAEVTVTPNPAESPEGEQQAALTYQISGTMYGNDKETLEGGITLKIENDENVTEKKAGETCNIVIELREDVKEQLKNYKIDTSAKGTYTILAAVFKEVTVKEGTTVVYDGKTHGIKAEGVPEGAQETYAYSVENGGPIAGKPKDAGKYTVTVTITLGQYKPYTVTRTLTISPKEITMTLQGQSAVYNGKKPEVSSTAYTVDEDAATLFASDVESGLTVTIDFVQKGETWNAQKYDLTATLGGTGAGNYRVTVEGAQKFEITRKAVTVTVGKQEKTFNNGTQAYDADWTAEGLENDENKSVLGVTLTGSGKDVGAYDVTASYESANYTVTFKAADGLSISENTVEDAFVITQKDASKATVTVNGTYTYDRTEKTVTVTVALEGFGPFVENTDYTISYAEDADRTNAGTVNFTVNFEGNYSGSTETSFEIKQATINSFTVEETKLVYTGEKKELTLTVKAGELVLTAETEYRLTVEGDLTKAGDHKLTVEGTGNFAGTMSKTVVIAKAQLTGVNVEGTYVYDGTTKTPRLTVSAGSLTPGEGDYTVSYEGNRVYAGTVNVTVTGTGNYQGSQTTSFEIARAVISVTLEDKNSVYGDQFEELTYSYEGVIASELSSVKLDSYVTVTTEATQKGDVNTYPITATVKDELANYTIKIVKQGTYTVTARPVSVRIEDQSATYDYSDAESGKYPFNKDKWELVADMGTLAAGETRDTLAITLTVTGLRDAGKYAITGSCGNANYAVTFVGSYRADGEDANNGKAGTYTIEKRDITEEAIFVLVVGEDEKTEGNVIYAKYAGETLHLTGSANLFESVGDAKSYKVTIDPETIDKIGNYTVTLTVAETNYCGSAVFTVIVTDAEGYTERLILTLERLEELVKGLDIEHLTAEDYETLVEVYAALESLDEAEQEVAAAELATYREYVDAWEELANIDSVVETAKTVANAPIETLFEAAAMLTALAGLAYIAIKGGLL